MPVGGEQQQEHPRKTQKFSSGSVRMRQGAERHHREGADRDAGAAEAVGEPAAEGAGERADERAEEGERDGRRRPRRRELRELVGDELREDAREADERAEGADVEQRHEPQVRLLERRGRAGEVGLRVREVVHVAAGAPHREQDERHPHPARERRFSVAAAPIVMTMGTTNWATAVPRLPPAALRPSAQPFSFCG